MTKGAMVVSTGVLFLVGGCATHTSIGGLGDDGGSAGQGQGGNTGGIGVGGIGGVVGGGGAGGGGNVDGGAACGSGTTGQPGGPARTLSFRDPIDYPTGMGAYFTTLGDLNGDGKLDLALLDDPTGLRVLLNDGSGTLLGPADHAVGQGGRALATGDLNGDGKIDVAVVTPAGVSVTLNQGNAAFAPPVTYAVGSGPIALALGDLNGDGRVDIAVANAGSSYDTVGDVAVLLNTGRGTFAATNYPAGNHPASIAIGDLNGDCRADLAVGDQTDGRLSVLLNSGNGGFKPATKYGAGTVPNSVAIADLNGDGKADLAEAGAYDTVYVLLGYGDGTFTAAVGYSLRDPTNPSAAPGGSAAPSVVIGDLNGDGNGDLAVVSGWGLRVLLNQGDGTFAAAMDYPIPYYGVVSVAFGDLDGDGRGDLAVVSSDNPYGYPYSPSNSSLRVRLNNSH